MAARANDRCPVLCSCARLQPQATPSWRPGESLGTSSTNPWHIIVKQLLDKTFWEALDADDSGGSTSCDDEAEHDEGGRYSLDSPIGSRLLARKLETQQERFAQQAFVLSSAPIVAHGPRENDGTGCLFC